MTKTNNTAVAAILSTLSPAAVEALRSHYREEVVTEITSTLGAAPKAAPKRTEKAEKVEKTGRGQNRQHTTDGRSASQFIRDCGEEMSAKDVVEAATKAGLDIEAPLVYNVRAQAKKKAEEAMNAEETAKKEAARKAVLQENAKKAREARQLKIAERKAAEEKAAEAAPAEAPAEAAPATTEAPAEAPAAAAPEVAAPAEAPKAKGKGSKKSK